MLWSTARSDIGSASMTLTSKTIDGASNTLSNIGNSSLTNSAITIAGTSTSLGGSISQDTITGLSTTGLVKRTGANTLAVATADTDYVTPSGTVTFTSKTISLASNTLTGTTAQFNTALSDGDFATLAGTETLTGKTLTSPAIGTSILDTNGNTILSMVPTAAATNYVKLFNDGNQGNPGIGCAGVNGIINLFLNPKGSGRVVIYTSAGNTPTLSADGNDTNLNLNLVSKGSGVVTLNSVAAVDVSSAQTLSSKTLTAPTMSSPKISDGYIKDSNGASAMYLPATASAVNFVQFINAATGNAIQMQAVGADANISAGIYSKGTGTVYLRGSGNGIALAANPVTSGVNYVSVTAAATGNAPTLAATGTDSNIDLNLTTTGTGVVKINSVAAVDVSSAQTLSNKTATSLKLTSGNAPASAAATGTAGQIEWDASGNLYLCVATDTWVKTTLATW